MKPTQITRGILNVLFEMSVLVTSLNRMQMEPNSFQAVVPLVTKDMNKISHGFFVKEECALRDLYRCDMATLETTLQSLGLMNQICNVMRGKRFMVTLQYKPKSPEDIEEQKRVNERTAARRRQRRRR
eukprot:1129240_1